MENVIYSFDSFIKPRDKGDKIKWNLSIYSIDLDNRLRGKELWSLMLIDEINRFLSNEKPLKEEDLVFCTHQKGKPYVKINSLEDKEIHFNISHSHGLLAILISNFPCGIDIQKNVKAKYEDIAKRFFNEEEKREIEIKGADAFFRLWTRKEAMAKATGEGLFGREKNNQNVLIEELDLNLPGYEGFYLAMGFVIEGQKCSAKAIK